MRLTVADIAAAVDAVADLAVDAGGWVVNSDRSASHGGSISIRVPAETLDDTIRRLRQLALKVESETSSSQDVTDEYVDIQSRLTGLRATEARLLEIMAQAESVKDALSVPTGAVEPANPHRTNRGAAAILGADRRLFADHRHAAGAAGGPVRRRRPRPRFRRRRGGPFPRRFPPPAGDRRLHLDLGFRRRFPSGSRKFLSPHRQPRRAHNRHGHPRLRRCARFPLHRRISDHRRRRIRFGGRFGHLYRDCNRNPGNRGFRRRIPSGRGKPGSEIQRLVHPPRRTAQFPLPLGIRRRLARPRGRPPPRAKRRPRQPTSTPTTAPASTP